MGGGQTVKTRDLTLVLDVGRLLWVDAMQVRFGALPPPLDCGNAEVVTDGIVEAVGDSGVEFSVSMRIQAARKLEFGVCRDRWARALDYTTSSALLVDHRVVG